MTEASLWDYLSAVGSIGTAFGLLLAWGSIRQAASARDLSTVESILQGLRESHHSLAKAGLLELESDEVELYLHLQFLEGVCWIMNHRSLSRNAQTFLSEWLDGELPVIMNAPKVRERARKNSPEELSEIRKYLAQLERQKSPRSHWERLDDLNGLSHGRGLLHDRKVRLGGR